MTDRFSNTELKPCHCGYGGALAGMQHGGFFSLGCPECDRIVEAFTLDGLAENWNKPALATQGAE
jgi:hypothetical protein